MKVSQSRYDQSCSHWKRHLGHWSNSYTKSINIALLKGDSEFHRDDVDIDAPKVFQRLNFWQYTTDSLRIELIVIFMVSISISEYRIFFMISLIFYTNKSALKPIFIGNLWMNSALFPFLINHKGECFSTWVNLNIMDFTNRHDFNPQWSIKIICKEKYHDIHYYTKLSDVCLLCMIFMQNKKRYLPSDVIISFNIIWIERVNEAYHDVISSHGSSSPINRTHHCDMIE
jgi:hypothetical protein